MPYRGPREFNARKIKRQAELLAFIRSAFIAPTTAELADITGYRLHDVTRDVMQFEHDKLIVRIPIKRANGRGGGCSLRWKPKELKFA